MTTCYNHLSASTTPSRRLLVQQTSRRANMSPPQTTDHRPLAALLLLTCAVPFHLASHRCSSGPGACIACNFSSLKNIEASRNLCACPCVYLCLYDCYPGAKGFNHDKLASGRGGEGTYLPLAHDESLAPVVQWRSTCLSFTSSLPLPCGPLKLWGPFGACHARAHSSSAHARRGRRAQASQRKRKHDAKVAWSLAG